MSRVCETCGNGFNRECATCREACRYEVGEEYRALLGALRALGEVETYRMPSDGIDVMWFARLPGGGWHDVGYRVSAEVLAKWPQLADADDRLSRSTTRFLVGDREIPLAGDLTMQYRFRTFGEHLRGPLEQADEVWRKACQFERDTCTKRDGYIDGDAPENRPAIEARIAAAIAYAAVEDSARAFLATCPGIPDGHPFKAIQDATVAIGRKVAA